MPDAIEKTQDPASLLSQLARAHVERVVKDRKEEDQATHRAAAEVEPVAAPVPAAEAITADSLASAAISAAELDTLLSQQPLPEEAVSADEANLLAVDEPVNGADASAADASADALPETSAAEVTAETTVAEKEHVAFEAEPHPPVAEIMPAPLPAPEVVPAAAVEVPAEPAAVEKETALSEPTEPAPVIHTPHEAAPKPARVLTHVNDVALSVAQVVDLPFVKLPDGIKQMIGVAAVGLLAGGVALLAAAWWTR